VEQRIENPCVPSSILGLATIFKKPQTLFEVFFRLSFCLSAENSGFASLFGFQTMSLCSAISGMIHMSCHSSEQA
ncbi:MAG: hypothetical protein ACN6NK_09680, partial [Acinetobacter pseudolwoffii]